MNEQYLENEEDISDEEVPDAPPEANPVCLRCLEPLDKTQIEHNLTYYCFKCGNPVNQRVASLPFVNIPYQMQFVGNLWGKIWSSEFSLPRRFFGVLVICLCYAPALIGVPFALTKALKRRSRV